MSKTITTVEGSRGIKGYQGSTSVAIPVLTPERPEKRQNGRRFKDDGDPSFTLTSQDRHGVAVEIREATKSGHATARGGETVSISRSRNREQEEDGSG